MSKTDRNGTDFTYGVDGLGRTLTIHASSGTATQNHTTAYNYGGQVSSISADGVTTSYTYDGYGRVVLELNLVTLGASGIPSQKAYTYDLSGRLLSDAITINGVTNTTSYEYDRLGRIVTVKENGETEATYTYDANGNRATMTLGNGEVTTYTYNLANMVKTLVNKDESNNTLSSCSYLYRLDGNQVGKQEGTKTTLYAYDDLGRLTAEAVTENQTTVTTGYTFDAYNNRATKTIGGITVTTYTYDANNRMLTETASIGTTNYTYDNNGSQLTTTIGASTTTNTYDLFGQLKSYTGADCVVTNYTYGPDGLRVSKSSGNTTIAYVWDGGNITNEFTSVTEGQTTTTTENRYIYGIGRIKAFFGMTEVYYLNNAHGDVTGLTDSSCDLTKSYVYDAFGIEVNPVATDANPFRYCGEYFDKETETYYLRARYYKPSTGRFTQQDPANDGLNWYVYCNNNPVSFVDPSGLVTVGAKAYAETYGAIVSLDKLSSQVNVSWGGSSFSFGINDTQFEDQDWYIDDSLFVKAFGLGDDACIVYMDSVTESISIRANFNITGCIADCKALGSSYRELFLRGIEKYWNGSFGKYEVSTYVGESSSGISVIIGDNPDSGPYTWWSNGWSLSTRGTIQIETGKYKGSPSYSAKDIVYVSAHEFGHVLGVSDMYKNKDYSGVPSIMNAFGGGPVQSWDIYMITRATLTNVYQNWPNIVVKKSWKPMLQ